MTSRVCGTLFLVKEQLCGGNGGKLQLLLDGENCFCSELYFSK